MKSIVGEASSSKPSQVYGDGLRSLSDNAIATMGSKETITRCLRYQKSKRLPKEPQITADLIVPELYQLTGENIPEEFLIFDNGNDAVHRIMIFSNRHQLKVLAESQR